MMKKYIILSLFLGLSDVIYGAAAGGAGGGGTDDSASSGHHPVGHRQVTIDKWPTIGISVDLVAGDKIEKFNEMIALSVRLRDHTAVNAAADLDRLSKTFSEGSIQWYILNMLSGIAEKFNTTTSAGEFDEETSARIYSGLVADIEVAANLFRFTKPGGLVIPTHLPDDEEYVARVIEVICSEQLSKHLDALEDFRRAHPAPSA